MAIVETAIKDVVRHTIYERDATYFLQNITDSYVYSMVDIGGTEFKRIEEKTGIKINRD